MGMFAYSKMRDGFQPEPPSAIDIDGCMVACVVFVWPADETDAIIGSWSEVGESLFMSKGPADIGGVIGCCPG